MDQFNTNVYYIMGVDYDRQIRVVLYFILGDVFVYDVYVWMLEMDNYKSDSYNWMPVTPDCSVCFTNSSPLLDYQAIIRCQKCNSSAHRFCYLPDSRGKTFICDACESNFKGICYLCENPGLLKRIGKNFAHPMCLIFNQFVMTTSFGKLTFMEIDNPKQGKKLKCGECGKSTQNVLKCSLKCTKNAHLYCAMRSYEPADGKGWRAHIQPCKSPNNYLDIFENLVLRTIRSQNKFLTKYLNIPKSIKAVGLPCSLYCEDHSFTLIECVCREFNEEKIDWMYCDSCCRWEHTDCIKKTEAYSSQLMGNNDAFICVECHQWRRMIENQEPVHFKQLPKLHFYDFIFLHNFAESRKYEIPIGLMEFMHTLPVVFGKEYAEIEYRKEIGKKVRPKIDLPALKKQLEENEDNYDKIAAVMTKQREKIELAWWMVSGNMIREKGCKQDDGGFIQIISEDGLTQAAIAQMVNVLIKFEIRFVGGKSPVLSQVKDRINGSREQELSPKPKEKSSDTKKSKSQQQQQQQPKVVDLKVKIEASELKKPKSVPKSKPKPVNFQYFCNSLKTIIGKFKSTHIKTTSFLSQNLAQLRTILMDKSIEPYHDQFPKTPIIKSILLFAEPNLSLEYLTGCLQLGSLCQEWQQFQENWSNRSYSDRIYRQSDLLRNCKDNFVNKILYCRNRRLMSEMMEIWYDYQLRGQLPHRKLTSQVLVQPELAINVSLLNIQYVDKLNNFLFARLFEQNRQEDIRTLQLLAVVKSILVQLGKYSFTEKNYDKVLALVEYFKINQQYGDIPIKILDQYLLLYKETDIVLADRPIISINSSLSSNQRSLSPNSECLITKLDRIKIYVNSYNRQQIILKYLQFFTKIRAVKLQIFQVSIFRILKEKFVWLLDLLTIRKTYFENEDQYNAVTEWMQIFQVECRPITEIIAKDKAVMERLTFLKPDFQNPELISTLSKVLEECLAMYDNMDLPFRTKKIILVQTWIQLYEMVLQNISPKILLSPKNATLLQDHHCKIDFSFMKQAYNMMQDLQFPKTEFFHKLSEQVTKGEAVKAKIDAIFRLCDWGYEWSRTKLLRDDKPEFQQGLQLAEEMKSNAFSFQVELIEMEIIMEKWRELDKQSQLLLIESSKRANLQQGSYLIDKLKQILSLTGTLPFRNKHTQQLLITLAKYDKSYVYRKSVQECVEEVENSNQGFAYHEVMRIQERVRCEVKEIERDKLISRLSIFLSPMQELLKIYGDLVDKYCNQKTPFTQAEMDQISKMLEQYRRLTLAHEDIARMEVRFYSYRYLLQSQRWMREERFCDKLKVSDVLAIVEGLHVTFLTQEIKEYRGWLEKLRDNQMRMSPIMPRQSLSPIK